NLGRASCVWNDFQSVGRRYNQRTEKWENVGVIGAAPALAPDVVVTLQEVNFCGSQIAITWSIQNNMDQESVSLPLSAENIAVRDSLGNEYQISHAKSRPSQIRVGPHDQARGTAVIARPANLNASTLRIMLKKLPFDETTWLVPISSASG